MIWLKIPYAQITEWMCFVASIILLLRAKPKFWRYFMPYLAITVAVETYGYYSARYITGANNHWLYNLFLAVYIIFHLFIFHKIISLKITKILCFFLFIVLLTAYLYEWSTLGFQHFFSATNTLFGGVIIILCLMYYYNFFILEEITDILKEPAFWFVTGCLFFYATSTSINAFFEEFVKYSKANKFPLRFVILNFLNIIMYTCWFKSFLCLRKAQISSQQLF